MKTLTALILTLIASVLFLPEIASADKKDKGPKHYWKQQEKWEKELRKRDDKYWKEVEKDRKEYWKRYDPWYPDLPYYGPRLEGEGYIGPYRFEAWR